MQIGCAALRSRYVDHHAAAVAQHLRNLVLHAHERAAQVDVEDAVDLIRLRHVALDREHLPAIRFDLDAKLIERSLGTVSMC